MRLGNTDGSPCEDPDSGRPLDLAALRADDALLDALGAGLIRPGEQPASCADSDRELVALLAAWVAEIRPDEPAPVPEAHSAPALPAARPPLLAAVRSGAADATVAVRPATPPDWRRWAFGAFARRLAAAALLVGIASAGVAVGSPNDVPGASPTALSRVAYAERARSTAAAAEVSGELTSARVALEQGRRDVAARMITAVRDRLPAVRADDGHDQLARDHQRLQAVLAASGGPPAAAELVLAATVPNVKPSDFLGNLPDRSDILAGSPSGQSRTIAPAAPDPADVILADGSRTAAAPTEGSSAAPAGGDVAGSAGATGGTGSTGRGRDAAAPGSPADVPSGGDQTGPATSGSATDGSDPGPASSADESTAGGATSEEITSGGTGSSVEPQTTADEPSSTALRTTTDARPSHTATSRTTAPSSPTESRSSTTQTDSPQTDSTRSSSTRSSTTRASTTPSGGSDVASGSGSASGPDATTTRVRSRSTPPRSNDFIGPVVETPAPATTTTSPAPDTKDSTTRTPDNTTTGNADGS